MLSMKRDFSQLYISARQANIDGRSKRDAMRCNPAMHQCSAAHTKNVIKIKEPRKVHNFASARQRVASFGHTKKEGLQYKASAAKKEQERSKAAKEQKRNEREKKKRGRSRRQKWEKFRRAGKLAPLDKCFLFF